jgi:hypothetical protein
MIIERLPTTLCTKQTSRGKRHAYMLISDFLRLVRLLPWEPGYGQTH